MFWRAEVSDSHRVTDWLDWLRFNLNNQPNADRNPVSSEHLTNADTHAVPGWHRLQADANLKVKFRWIQNYTSRSSSLFCSVPSYYIIEWYQCLRLGSVSRRSHDWIIIFRIQNVIFYQSINQLILNSSLNYYQSLPHLNQSCLHSGQFFAFLGTRQSTLNK